MLEEQLKSEFNGDDKKKHIPTTTAAHVEINLLSLKLHPRKLVAISYHSNIYYILYICCRCGNFVKKKNISDFLFGSFFGSFSKTDLPFSKFRLKKSNKIEYEMIFSCDIYARGLRVWFSYYFVSETFYKILFKRFPAMHENSIRCLKICIAPYSIVNRLQIYVNFEFQVTSINRFLRSPLHVTWSKEINWVPRIWSNELWCTTGQK